MRDERRIVAAAEVPDDDTFLFRVDDDGEEREAILLRQGEDVVAWLNYCQHFTHIKLDKGSGAPLRDGEVVCSNHGAMFDVQSGECTFGPCQGAYLNPVDVQVEDDAVYLTDEDYEFAGTGGLPDDDLDLTSTSNVEF